MSNSPWLKSLAIARRITGRTIRLGVEDTVENIILDTDSDQPKIYIVMRVARISERKNGYVVTDRGIRTILFIRADGMGWNRDEVTVWGQAQAAEHHVTRRGRTPEEDVAQREWEDMCYRPGTKTCPLDNTARREQGYTTHG